MTVVSEALQVVDRVMRFSRQRGIEDLDQALMIVTEKLQDIQITNRRQQKLIFFTDKFCLYLQISFALCKVGEQEIASF